MTIMDGFWLWIGLGLAKLAIVFGVFLIIGLGFLALVYGDKAYRKFKRWKASP